MAATRKASSNAHWMGGGRVSTEQRDKAALEEYPDSQFSHVPALDSGMSFGEVALAERGAFGRGWDAHAATMPDREALKANLWTQLEEALAEGPLFDMNDPRERLGFDKLMGETADAVLALLSKEGEE